MKRRNRMIAAMMSFILLAGCAEGNDQDVTINEEQGVVISAETENEVVVQDSETEKTNTGKTTEVSYQRVSVHDPSIVWDDGVYYIFGSHMAWAKSTDLKNWETFTMNINSDYEELFGEEWENYCRTENNPELSGNLWAPDVIYNSNMEKYCMYMSVNGSDWNSVIVLLTADEIEGPYTYQGPVVYSGFNTSTHPAELTDVYQVLGEGADLNRYQSIENTKLNCIDPCVKFDEDGKLWMCFGSWFGGIYMLQLDEKTGLRNYEMTYETIPNEQDAYYGYKIAGGFSVSGEGPYIISKDGYYYLFLSYGGLTAQGGYQMRVFRSEAITGPYVDENGTSAIFTKKENNLFTNTGIRLMGSYHWTGNREVRTAQGHNSAIVTDDGRIFLVYHTRFTDGKNNIAEAHEVRVQQMFVNEDGWLVCAPYEYADEVFENKQYPMEEMTGEYEVIIHTPTTYYQQVGSATVGVMEASHIVLNEDMTVSGDLQGTWTYEAGNANMSITLEGVTYRGVFLEMPSEQLFFHPEERKVVLTFTALGENVTLWGSK